MTKPRAQLIDPKSLGERRLQLKTPVFDPSTFARVDSALESMSGSFQEWLCEEIDKLQSARTAAQAEQWTDESLAKLAHAAHDLKGVAGMYGYPIITQLAASLNRLIETEAGKAAARTNVSLVEAHVDAIRVAARDDIRTDENPLGRQVLAMLRERVEALGVAPD